MDGKSRAQIEEEVQQVIQSVLGTAVAPHLPLMQASVFPHHSCISTIEGTLTGTQVNECSAELLARCGQRGITCNWLLEVG